MDVKELFPELLERLKTKYPKLSEEDCIETIEFSVYQFKRLSNDLTIESFTPHEGIWIKRACYEAIERTGLGAVGGIKQYSENGYQFTLDGAEISLALASEVVPEVGCPK